MTVDEALRLLPRGEDTRPLLRALVSTSEPDPERTWAGSGELATSGGRLLRPAAAARRLAELVREEEERRRRVTHALARAVDELSAGRPEGGVEALLEAALLEEEGERPERALHYALAARDHAREAGLGAAAIRAARRAARACRRRGDLDTASSLYETAWREARALDLGDLAVTAATGRGNLAVDRGRWDDAEGWYLRALESADSAGDGGGEPWEICQNLAIVARERRALDRARTWLERAQAGAPADDPDATVEVNNGWGQLLLAEGRPERAEVCFRRALAAAGTPLARTVVSVNLAECLLSRGRVLEAAELARQAEATALVEGVETRLPEVYRLLGTVATARGHEDALVFYERALELVRDGALGPFEEALTLEAYGRWRLESDEPDEAGLLLERAALIYEGLGIAWRAEAARRATTSEEEA